MSDPIGTSPRQYRKKPVAIDAMQFTGTNADDCCAFAGESCKVKQDARGPYLLIETLEGFHVASDGDWIIRGVKGEFYPCKPDIFALTYESVEGVSVGTSREEGDGRVTEIRLRLCEPTMAPPRYYRSDASYLLTQLDAAAAELSSLRESLEGVKQAKARDKTGEAGLAEECERLAADIDRRLSRGGPFNLARSTAFSIRNALMSASATHAMLAVSSSDTERGES